MKLFGAQGKTFLWHLAFFQPDKNFDISSQTRLSRGDLGVRESFEVLGDLPSLTSPAAQDAGRC